MPTRNPSNLPPSGRLLALDVGAKRVGAAVSDSARTTALPKGVWPRPWAELKILITQTAPAGVVLGEPLNMDGTTGPMATAAASLADLIEKELQIPTLLWDERLTSRQSEQAFFENRTGRQTRASKRESTGNVDAGAATLILQSVLSALKSGRH